MTPHDPTSQRFEWQAIRERFDRLQQATARADQLTPEEAEAVMVERARVLAQVPAEAPDSSEILELMIIQLGNERFALETRFVREVQPVGHITPVPDAPQFLLGVANLRGEVLAVIDLRSFFEIAVAESARSQLVVLGTERPEFGILVDDVHEVTELRIGEVLEPPSSVSGISRDYLRGVTEDALLVLATEVVLGDERLYMDQRD